MALMKAGLVGPSYKMASPNFNDERSINLYPVLSEVPESKDVAAMYGTPGLKSFSQVGDGPIRGSIACGNGRVFSVSANVLYEVFFDGTSNAIGMISTFQDPISMAENGLQLMIATGDDGYIFTFGTDVLEQIIDVDFPGANYVTFSDGYFIITPPNNQGKFYISALYDGLIWDALDFATAESSPDGLVGAYASNGQLMLFGMSTTEIWYNNGEAAFPYARLSGGIMQTGTPSAFTIAQADNSIFWVGQDSYGGGVVYRANGVTPKRVSNYAVELAIGQAMKQSGTLGGLLGFCYQQDGHLFYIVTGGSLQTTWCYDCSTNLWHERAYLDNGQFKRWLGVFPVFAFNKNLVGDRVNGNIYEIDPETYDDNGQEIKRTRIFTHIYNQGQRFKISSLQVDFEGGVGLTVGQGSDPQVWLRMSYDGGHTWTSEYNTSIGKKGEYTRRAEWRRLGVQRSMTFDVSISDPVKVAICGSWFNAV
jgi:hypothetical protein